MYIKCAADVKRPRWGRGAARAGRLSSLAGGGNLSKVAAPRCGALLPCRCRKENSRSVRDILFKSNRVLPAIIRDR